MVVYSEIKIYAHFTSGSNKWENDQLRSDHHHVQCAQCSETTVTDGENDSGCKVTLHSQAVSHNQTHSPHCTGHCSGSSSRSIVTG